MVHLRAPGLNVTGVALPGVPGVIIGHNESIAWGVTNLQFDVQDLYRERIDAQGRYEFQGQVEQARLEREAIAVKDAKPVELNQWVTRHGPVFLNDQGHQYALRWTAADSGGFAFPFLDIDRAQNWAQFTEALARFPGPGQNFVFADVNGNIGYHAAARLPIRPANCKGDVPADGAAGDCEWQGFIPFDALPQWFNPAQGMVVTANQNPFPEKYDYPVAGDFAAYYRAHEIKSRLNAAAKWRPDQMLAVQKDVYSEFSVFLAQQIVAAWDARKAADLRDAVDVLRNWNGQMEKDTAAPLIVTLAYQELQKAVANRAAPGFADSYDYPAAPVVIETLLRERPPAWFADYGDLLLKCLREGIQAGVKLQGSKIDRWNYGRYNLLTIANPVIGQLPLIGKRFNIGPVPMSGSPTTIKQSTRRLGPSMRMVVDLSDLDHSLLNITIGESGQALSWHYRDQWRAYYGGTSFPMQFGRVDAKNVLIIQPR
jgi:penicillin G amidase